MAMPQPQYVIEVHAIDWVVLLTRLLAKHKDEVKSGEDVTIAYRDDGSVVYSIRRDLLTEDELAKMTGTTPEEVRKAHTIVLRPIKTENEWPKPTVGYVGTA